MVEVEIRFYWDAAGNSSALAVEDYFRTKLVGISAMLFIWNST